MSRADLARCNCWRHAFADKRKDSRYYELVEDTIREGFEYKYFAIEDEHREVIADDYRGSCGGLDEHAVW